MLILAFLANLEPAQQQAFPERMPALIEACLEQAVEGEQAATEKGEHKYICTGQPARDLWSFLENRNVRA
ncbi:hypothetical protein [Sphingomonas sp. LHG3406-1]|uniref:hypothetical protein n=1 Tax=Sphingomonas sp. LHG3406-1 TaxID=2804617 RepID=UPI00261826EE|nr:hypothetical protein [Sphingomonas sp. LHG3406-1]